MFFIAVSDWLIERGKSASFEEASCDELNTMLRQFYGELMPKKGQRYSRSAYMNIRNGINRHLNAPPFSRKLNIMQDRDFAPANQVFTAVLKELRRDGMDKTKHKDVIEKEDIEKMFATGALGTDNPLSLQRKIFFDISFHFARRGREGLRSLKKSSFEVQTDATGKKYVAQTFNEKEKTRQGLSNKEVEKNVYMYEEPDNPERCKVRSFQLYLSKLNTHCESLFQRPKKTLNLAQCGTRMPRWVITSLGI